MAQLVEKRPVECDTSLPRSRRPIAVEDDQTGDDRSYSMSSSGHPGESLSQTLRKPKPLPKVSRLSFSRWHPSVLAVIEMVEVALMSYFLTLASEPKLTNPDKVHEAIGGLKFSKGSRPERYPKQRLQASSAASSFPPGADLQSGCPHPPLPQVWKHAWVITILKPGKDLTLPSVSTLAWFGWLWTALHCSFKRSKHHQTK